MVRWRRFANEFATSRLERQTEEPAMWRNVVPCDQPAVQGNDSELIPTVTMESRHSVDGPTSRDFSPIYIVRELWGPEVGSRSRFFKKSCLLGKSDPLWGNFQIFVPKGFIATQIHMSCVNFVIFYRLEVGEITRCLLNSARSLALASDPIAPKICQGQRQTMYSECPKFNPNRFTSGGVIAERVNIVERAIKCLQYSAKLQLLRRVMTYRKKITSVLYVRSHLDRRHTDYKLYSSLRCAYFC